MSDEKDQENPPAVQAAIDEAAATRKKYGHPDPDTAPRQVEERPGFIRWYQKGGPLDPESEEQTPEYLQLWRKLGGGRDHLELSDGTVIRRSRAPEDPEQARDLDKVGTSEERPTEGSEPTQGLRKSNTPSGASARKPAKSTPITKE